MDVVLRYVLFSDRFELRAFSHVLVCLSDFRYNHIKKAEITRINQ